MENFNKYTIGKRFRRVQTLQLTIVEEPQTPGPHLHGGGKPPSTLGVHRLPESEWSPYQQGEIRRLQNQEWINLPGTGRYVLVLFT